MSRPSSSEVTEERLERALRTMAKVIDQHGDVYWPIFEAIKKLLDEKRARRRELRTYLPQNDSEPSQVLANVHDIRRSKTASR